jgi:hypothetical protein
MAVNNKEPHFMTKLMTFLEKYWLVIGGILIAFPLLKRYLAKQQELGLEQQKTLLLDNIKQNTQIVKETKFYNNLDPKLQLTSRQKITAAKELWAISTKIANDFGVIYSDDNGFFDFLNPRGWTENDKAIADTLIKYRNYFDKLEKLYFEVDTNSRNLRKDILKYLDAGELKRLRKLLKI